MVVRAKETYGDAVAGLCEAGRNFLAPARVTDGRGDRRPGSQTPATTYLLLRLFLLRQLRSRRQQQLHQRAARAIVEADDAFLAAGGDDRAVRADADRVEEVGRRRGEVARVAAIIDVPHAHLLIARAGDEFR